MQLIPRGELPGSVCASDSSAVSVPLTPPHRMHPSAPAAEYIPTLQGTHALAPEMATFQPGAQGEHSGAPRCSMKLPGGQSSQPSPSAPPPSLGLNLPTSHEAQDSWAVSHWYLPGKQDVHEVAPLCVSAFPRGQSRQFVLSASGWNVPGRHASQTIVPESLA